MKIKKYILGILSFAVMSIMMTGQVYAKVSAVPGKYTLVTADTCPQGIVMQTINETDYTPSEGKAAIVFHVNSMPDDFNGGVFCDVRYSPDKGLGYVTVSGLTGYTQAIEISPTDNVYWSCTRVGDTTQENPVNCDYGSIYAYNGVGTLKAGEVIIVNMDITNVSMYKQFTGEDRNYKTVPVETAEEGYDTTKKAQIGVHCSMSNTFSGTINVYLENVYTGQVYTLNVYESNNMAAFKANATQGKYKYLGCKLNTTELDKDKCKIICEKDEITTEEGANFHLTIIDTDHPDAKIITPNIDNNEQYQEAVSSLAEAKSKAEAESKKSINENANSTSSNSTSSSVVQETKTDKTAEKTNTVIPIIIIGAAIVIVLGIAIVYAKTHTKDDD